MSLVLQLSALTAGFFMLVWGADRFIDGAANLARHFGVAPLLIGLTIVAFGTSAPEILVSALAAWEGNPLLGIGNAIGSNIANVGLVLGITLLIAPLVVGARTLQREFPLLGLVMLLAGVLLWDLHLSRLDGLILISGFLLVVSGMLWLAFFKNINDPLTRDVAAEYQSATLSKRQAGIFFLIGLVVLLAGAELLIWGAVGIAQWLGVSDLVIGLTIVAVGTSLPELAACVAAVLKKQYDLAVGNILGSNIFNLLAVLAVPALIYPTGFDHALLSRDFFVMVTLVIMLFLLARYCPQGKLFRLSGALLLCSYLGYTALLIYQGLNGTL